MRHYGTAILVLGTSEKDTKLDNKAFLLIFHLKFGWGCNLAVRCSPPANHYGLLANPGCSGYRQTDWHDVLLVGHVLGQPDERNIILERRLLVVRVDLLALDLVVLVRKLFTLLADVPLSKTDSKLAWRGRMDAVSRRQDPP